MSNLMQGTSFHDEGDARFETNEHVRTVEVAKPANLLEESSTEGYIKRAAISV